MFKYLFEWIQNLAFYLVIITAVFQVIPGNGYKKYVKFFSGLVLILLMLTPIMKLTGIEKQFNELYHSRTYEMEQAEIIRQQDYFEGMNILDFMPAEYQESGSENADEENTDDPDKIEVGEIEVGK